LSLALFWRAFGISGGSWSPQTPPPSVCHWLYGPNYILVVCAGTNRKAVKKGSKAHASPSDFYPRQKRPQPLNLWMCSQQSKRLWYRQTADWPVWAQPSSSRFVPASAMCSYKEWNPQVISSLPYLIKTDVRNIWKVELMQRHLWSSADKLESSLKCDGTRWRTGGEVKGKLANGVGNK